MKQNTSHTLQIIVPILSHTGQNDNSFLHNNWKKGEQIIQGFLFLLYKIIYLATGPSSEWNFEEMEVVESICGALWFNSRFKHSLSSLTTWLIVGLFIGLMAVQDIPMSTAFHTEFVLHSSLIFGSIIEYISPWLMFESTHWIMWLFSLVFTSTGLPVTSSRITIPKL